MPAKHSNPPSPRLIEGAKKVWHHFRDHPSQSLDCMAVEGPLLTKRLRGRYRWLRRFARGNK